MSAAEGQASALERLAGEEVHVVVRDGAPLLVDPLFREWLRRR